MFFTLPRNYIPFGIVLLLALSFKFILASASPSMLNFLLWPPAKITGLCFSSAYYWHAEQGYVFPSLGMYINKGCSALTFLTILFLALSTIVIFFTSGTRRFYGLTLVLLISYPLCLLVNSVRIILSVHINSLVLPLSLSQKELIHELTGGVCFFGSLLLISLLAERILTRSVRLNASH